MGRLEIRTIRVLAVTIAFFPFCAESQETFDVPEERNDAAVESALEHSTEDVEDSQYAEILLRLAETPIDINSASASDLEQVPGIDPMLANRIVAARERRPFGSVDELMLLDGLDPNLFGQIRNFLKVVSRPTIPGAQQGFSMRYRGRTIRDVHDRQGFVDGSYLGSPYKVYNRIEMRYPLNTELRVEVGGLTEKDQGEKSIAEFYTGYISLATRSASTRFVLGDYVVESGQGLVLWRSTGATKSNQVIGGLTKSPRGVRPYASSDENGFFRGAAVQAFLGRIGFSAFFSNKAINARLDDDGSITSFDASGLTRTLAELRTRSSSSEQLVGMGMDVPLSRELRIGCRGYVTRFGNRVDLSSTNGFEGKSAEVGSIDLAYASTTLGMFGEIAMDHARSVAGVGGVLVEPISDLGFAIVARSYPQQFVSLHGFGFGESGSQLQNERGVYTGLKVSVCKWLSFSTYYDQFTSLGQTTVSLLPTRGNEFLGVVDVRPLSKTLVQIQLKHRIQSDKQYSADEYSRLDAVVGQRVNTKYRFSFEWNPVRAVRWRTRFETSKVTYTYSGSPANGMVLYQDLHLKAGRGVSVDGRVIAFDTDSYDSRVYEYESELAGTFVNPALYGKGVRLYILGRYRPGNMEFSLKYSITVKPGAVSIGTGDNEIRGDSDGRLSAQIDVSI
jgi:hypothetical protein